MTLREVFHQAEREEPHSWLFLAGDSRDWTLDTEAFLVDTRNLDVESDTDEPIPPELAGKGLRCTLDTYMINECVKCADRLVGRPDDCVRLESFIYYFRFDASSKGGRS
jgi:hypothetical protein